MLVVLLCWYLPQRAGDAVVRRATCLQIWNRGSKMNDKMKESSTEQDILDREIGLPAEVAGECSVDRQTGATHNIFISGAGDIVSAAFIPALYKSLENKESDVVVAILKRKHLDYARKAKLYSRVYYLTRLTVALSAGSLPFVVSHNTTISTALSIIIVFATIIDMVFNPKQRWELYSKTSDLLTVAELKAQGNYEKYKKALDVVVATERSLLEGLINLDDLVNRVQKASKDKG